MNEPVVYGCSINYFVIYNIHLYRLATVAGDVTSKDVSMTTMTSHRAWMLTDTGKSGDLNEHCRRKMLLHAGHLQTYTNRPRKWPIQNRSGFASQ